MVLQIHSKAQLQRELAKAEDTLVIVDFFATWCEPCDIILPHLQAFQMEFGKKLLILKVDVDECEALANEYDATAMPTFIFFRHGGKYSDFHLDEMVGALPEMLRSKIVSFL